MKTNMGADMVTEPSYWLSPLSYKDRNSAENTPLSVLGKGGWGKGGQLGIPRRVISLPINSAEIKREETPPVAILGEAENEDKEIDKIGLPRLVSFFKSDFGTWRNMSSTYCADMATRQKAMVKPASDLLLSHG